MKAIILSAGQGSRLGHLVDDRPKCLIDFGGRTLLDRQLDTLEANGVHEAVVVTGFHDELVTAAIAKRSGGPAVRTIFNPFYKVADNTGSLFMAREERFREAIGREMRTAEGTTVWYLRVIHYIAQNSEVWTLDIKGEEWGEVDFPPDVDAARELTARWDAAEKVKAA